LEEADSRELAEWKAYFLYEDQKKKKDDQKNMANKLKATLTGMGHGGKS